jgi:hypothetical protein
VGQRLRPRALGGSGAALGHHRGSKILFAANPQPPFFLAWRLGVFVVKKL